MGRTKAKASSAKAAKAAGVPNASIIGERALAREGFSELSAKGYGKESGGKLELSLVEALYLLGKGKIRVLSGKKAVGEGALSRMAQRLDGRFCEKAVAYADLRDRGLVVKTGFKFGCDFRVYGRGVNVRKGQKAPGEHTRWIVHVASEGYTCAFQEMARAVRLAHSIRARMLWAVVDSENNVTYYEILRLKP